jgi:hypothetical protein
MHRPLALDVNNTTGEKGHGISCQVLRKCVGDMDATGFAGRLHAAGDVDGVAPDIILQTLAADDAGRDRSDVCTDAKLHATPPVAT